MPIRGSIRTWRGAPGRLQRTRSPGGVTVITEAYDLDGKPKISERQTMNLNPAPDSRGPDLLSRLPLSPGRYMVRVAAEHGEKSGHVFLDVDVPDFGKAPLSMSGVILQRAPAQPVPDAAIASLVRSHQQRSGRSRRTMK